MKIDLVPCEGPIAREIPGLSKLQAAMPAAWFAYANREIAVGKRAVAEIDLLIVGDDRIYVVDLKDWNGVLENDQGRWLQNGVPRGRSAVRKVRENAKKIATYLRSRLPPKVGSIFVEGFVVSTATLDYSSLPEDERIGVLTLAEFASVGVPKSRLLLLEDVHRGTNARPLTDFRIEFDLLMRISSAVKPRLFRPFGFELGSAPEFVHRSNLYREFSGLSTTGDRGVVRHWDFTKLPIAMQEVNARTEILARETRVRDHLALHSAYFESDEWALKRLGVDDDIELLELPRALLRATNYFGKAAATVGTLERLDKFKALVATITEMHKIGCAHSDLGPYSVWLGSGTRHKLSNLAAARIPSSVTLGPQRFLLVNNNRDTVDCDDPFQLDVMALAGIGIALLKSAEGSSDTELASINELLDRAQQIGGAASAAELLADLNKLDPRANSGAIAMQELAERAVSSTNPYVAYPMVGAPQSRGDQLTYGSVVDGTDVVVKIWNSVSNSSSVDRIFSALPAFLKARGIMESQNKAFAPVLDCGIGQGASFVVMRRISGDVLARSHESADKAIDICRALVSKVSLAHEAGFAHGDLSPSNVRIMMTEGRPTPTFIDFIHVDLGPKDFTPAYSPNSDCDDFQRDAFAAAKIVIEILSSACDKDGISTNARAVAEGELEDGWRDPSLLIAKLRAALLPPPTTQESATSIDLPVATLSAKMDLRADGGCYYLRYVPPKPPEQGTLIVNGLSQAIKLPVDERGVVAVSYGRLGPVDSALLSRLRTQTPRGAVLRGVSIRLVPLGTGNDLDAIAASASKWLAKARQPAEDMVPKLSEATASIARIPRSRKDAWSVFAQAESEARFQLRITGSPFEESGSLVFPVNGWQVPEDFMSPRVVYRVNRHGDEIELGGLHFTRSGPKEVAVDGVSLQDIPASGLPMLVIRDRRNESARDKKVAAAKRLAANEGARTNLLDEFDALAARENKARSFMAHQAPVTQEDVAPYELNADQREAVLGALNGDGLFLLQGPPGTGKTKTIAALVHIIATKLGSRRILVASQTHEAVNNAASKIAETFEALNTPLDMVRVGNEDDVADDLLAVHTAALRRDFVSLFAAEADSRLRPIGREIGLADATIDALFEVHRFIVEPLERAVSWDRGGTADRVKVRPEELRQVAQSAFAEKFPSKELLMDDLSAARLQLASLVATHSSSSASPDQCHRFLNVISAAGDTVRRLGGGASDGAFGEFLVKTRAIACGTCVGIGSSAFKLADKVFDWVIVDEAARCTPTELAVAIQSGRKVVLVGDHLQLPPFIGPEVKAALQKILDAKDVSSWCASDFETMFDSSDTGRASCASLWDQYRMIEPISRVVSDLAYDGKLDCKRTGPPAWVSRLPKIGQSAVTLVDTSSFGPSEDKKANSTSFRNSREADWIVEWLKAVVLDRETYDALVTATVEGDQAAVGVICAYADQVELVKGRIYDEGLEDACSRFLKIGTVDSYQGRENVVVIVSLVRSNPGHSVGHVHLFQRINVALSRAKDRLVVIGDSAMWLDPANADFLAGKAWKYIHDRADGVAYSVVGAA